MEKGNIELVFCELLRLGQCSSRSAFSRDWLGREESYYRSIQCKGRKPSIEAQMNLAVRLRWMGDHLRRSLHPKVAAAGKTYLKLHGDLLDSLMKRTRTDTANAELNLVRL
jgi:hypothetical protein